MDERSAGNLDSDIDRYNDETFGDGADEGDWESSHFTQQEGMSRIPRETDDVIPTKQPLDVEEVLPQVAQLKIKELWPSSPKQSTLLDSIWTPPQLPSQPKPKDASPLPSGSRVMTLEELEREYSTPSPPQPVTSSPSHTVTPPQSHSIAPPPGLARMPEHPIRHMSPVGMHVHPQHMMALMRNRPPLRGPLPPPSHGFPPMLPHPPIPILQQRMPGHLMSHPPPPHLHPSHHHQAHFSPPHSHRHSQNPRQQQPHGFGDQGAPRKSRRSEYLGEMKADGSGFMTQKEKEWVIKIQLLQLQSPDPSNDDYYYQNYIQRKHSYDNQKHSSPASSSSSGPHPSHSDNEGSPRTQVLTLPQVSREERHYTPIVFEKTLGKVSVSSISAPRKTIDVPLNVSEPSGKETGLSNMHTKKRQALITIEKLYSLVLSLEDLERRALALPEEDRPQMLAQRDEICLEMVSLLNLKASRQQWTKSDDAVLLQIMSYRKGKRVMKRILPVLSDTHAHMILLALLRNISSVVKRDTSDQVLPELSMSVQAVISSLDFCTLNSCLATLLAVASAQLVKVVQSEFGGSLLLAVIERGQKLVKSSREPEIQDTNDYDKWIEFSTQLSSELYPHKEQLSRHLTLINWLESV